MIRLILAALTAVTLSGPVPAQEGPVQGVIADQIEAFQRDDFDAAFGFASPLIQGLFGTPENFGLMVRRGYPMVWRPADVQYLDQRVEAPYTYQNIRIRDADGAVFNLEYQMIATPDGWQINGVQFIEAPGLSA